MFEEVKQLTDVVEPTAGQSVFCAADQKYYRWDPVEGWTELNMEGVISMNAYDVNKQIIGQLEILDEAALEEKHKLIREFVNKTNNKYFMLLCRDLNYYTLFVYDTHDAQECIDDVVIECANFLGKIKAIDTTEDQEAIEIWITNSSDSTHVMYFFAYDTGVIECG